MTIDEDDDFRRANYLKLFGTSVEAEVEAEAEAREMAERQAKIKHDEVMEWCRQRAEAREAETSRRREVPYDGAGQPLPVVTKSYGAPVTQRAAAVAPSTMTQEWQRYIKRAIQKASLASDEAMAKAIAQSLGKDLVALERSNAALQERVQHLETEVADLFRMTRAQARDAEVAEKLAQYDELQDRLARLEGNGRPLKVVGG